MILLPVSSPIDPLPFNELHFGVGFGKLSRLSSRCTNGLEGFSSKFCGVCVLEAALRWLPPDPLGRVPAHRGSVAVDGTMRALTVAGVERTPASEVVLLSLTPLRLPQRLPSSASCCFNDSSIPRGVNRDGALYCLCTVPR